MKSEVNIEVNIIIKERKKVRGRRGGGGVYIKSLVEASVFSVLNDYLIYSENKENNIIVKKVK